MSIPIYHILEQINHIEYIGNPNQVIKQIIQLDVNNTNSDVLFWCHDKNLEKLYQIQYGTVICSPNIDKLQLNSNCNYIIVESPRSVFQQVLKHFFINEIEKTIAKSAKIHPSVILGKDVLIGENVVIEEGSQIGDDAIILHNTVIFRNSIIGNHVVVGANCTIGGTGFGYERNEKGDYQFIPHIGNVIIKDHVEIGQNSCVDRGVIGSTILHENVKIDNLVHIAHGVEVDKNTLITANSMIAGSAKIGHDVWIAPSSSVMNNKSVGDHAFLGMGAVVLKDVGDNEVVVGNPAKLLRTNKQE